MRILLVDDDPVLLRALAASLRAMHNGGHEVTTVQSGSAALNLLEMGARFDVIVLDFLMPSMSGADLATRIRRLDQTTPILCMSGTPEEAADAFGADRTISKPCSTKELLDKIRGALNGGFHG